MKDHEIARLVNELRDVAVQYKDADQLRARIAHILTPVLQEKTQVEQKPVQKPVQVVAVAVMKDDGDGGLAPQWLLEGGAAELVEGMVLVVAEDGQITNDEGRGEVYTAPQPAPAQDVAGLAKLVKQYRARLMNQRFSDNDEGDYRARVRDEKVHEIDAALAAHEKQSGVES